MWCAVCHTFWHWETRRILDRGAPPHNPEHRAWQANGGREVDDLPCGGIPDIGELHDAFMRTILRNEPSLAPSIIEVIQSISASQALRRTRYRKTWDDLTTNEAIRIDFINGKLDETQFAMRLERQERTCHFERDVHDVIETYVMCALDILQRFVSRDDPTMETFAYVELIELCGVTCDAMRRVGSIHGRKTPTLDVKTWKWTLPGTTKAREG